MSGTTSGDVNGISVYFKPWTTEDWFSISSLNLREELGGQIAEGEMGLIVHAFTKDSLSKIESMRTGTIEIKANEQDTPVLGIPIFITKTSYYKNFLTIQFICTTRENDEFITKNISQSYSGIEDAISTFFPEYDTDIDPTTDLTKLRINQINESGIEFCNKLAIGWRPKTVFGYDLKGNIIIRDLAEITTKSNIIIGKTRLFTKFPIKSRSPLLDTDPFNPWESESKDIEYNLTKKKDYSENEPTNITSRVWKDTYSLHSPSFDRMLESASYNGRLYKSKFYSEGEILANTFPKYKLGDIVEITSSGLGVTKADKESEGEPELENNIFIIGSWELYWSGQGDEGRRDKHGYAFSVTSKIYGLEENE